MVVPSDPVFNHCLIRNPQLKSSAANIFICTSLDDVRAPLLATPCCLESRNTTAICLVYDHVCGRTLLSAAFDLDVELKVARTGRKQEELIYLEHNFSEVLALKQ